MNHKETPRHVAPDGIVICKVPGTPDTWLFVHLGALGLQPELFLRGNHVGKVDIFKNSYLYFLIYM